ncbi:hypothetical protein DV515_00019850 [Chloebia gouldiae]|uniref:Uncharacterized protein n=1 Tax=Chloebia gouldiae TaxID=44316 RepID=A0A3L8Q437_CHLGU|nr:hypothetical protein DV515_00019850 [Chloebia gouldiae]
MGLGMRKNGGEKEIPTHKWNIFIPHSLKIVSGLDLGLVPTWNGAGNEEKVGEKRKKEPINRIFLSHIP